MPSLKITRSNEYANRIRDIKIFLDGTLLGRISNGETKDFEITAGDHLRQAKIDWCTNNKVTFNIGGDRAKNFYLDSFANHNSIGIFATICYATFGANKYLTRKEPAR